MKAKYILFFVIAFFVQRAHATGEAGTYFNIYIPPSAVTDGKDVSLVVTALYDSTFFRINDTGEDGDTDDSASGYLMAGQSYVLFLRDNGVNDDAPHAGETGAKQDGDHFLVTGSKLILVSQAVKSDWQHDWLPSTNKTSKGTKFFIYANEVGISPNDLNVMAYQDSTFVSIWKISRSTNSGTGFTKVQLTNDSLIAQLVLAPGKDMIYQYHTGRDILKPGETYLIQSNKDVTVQYGALYGDEQDGGGYVPSSNGTGSGELFYFPVPFEDSLQQEIRIVSWSANNNIVLERYSNGQWITVKQFDSVNRYKAVEWVGKNSGQTFATVFRVRCTAGKKVSVFEGNWIETGPMNTGDISSMVPSETGNSASNSFVVYMPTPGSQGNITNPLTGLKMPAKGTHAYIFGNRDSVSHVTVKDANTNGAVINRTYTVPAGFYADCELDSLQWLSIYNGTGLLADGPQRPYLIITSDKQVSVNASNHNDNWTSFFGAAIAHGFDLTMSSNRPDAAPGDTVKFTTNVNLNGNTITHGVITQTIANGLRVLTSYVIDSTTRVKTMGTIHVNNATGVTTVTYGTINQFTTTHLYRVITNAMATCSFANGGAIALHSLLGAETDMAATVHGNTEMATANLSIASLALRAPLQPTFSVSATNITEGESVTCTSNSTYTSYNWNFGDHSQGTGHSICHTYQATGNFYIALTVSNAAGCTATTGKTVEVATRHCVTQCNNNELHGCVQQCHAPEPAEGDNDEKSMDATSVNTVEEVKEPAIWSNGDRLYIDFKDESEVNAQIKVFNLLAQEIGGDRFTGDLNYMRQMDGFITGYYIVSVKNKEKIYSKKVFISSR